MAQNAETNPPHKPGPRIYMLVGEPSGDLHASNLQAALRAQVPGVQFRGLGGDRMAAQGTELLHHIRRLSIMGAAELLRHLPFLLRLFREVKADILAWQPDLVVLVDNAGFNLRMAKWLHGQGIRTVYYIAPKLWAWNPGRARQMRRYVDQLLVILPFEEAFFAQYGVQATYVGHPLMDELEGRSYRPPDALGLPTDKPLLALLPGSRASELKQLLLPMLRATKQLPQLQPVIAVAPSQPKEIYEQMMQQAGVQLPMVQAATYDLVAASRVAVVTSGTATLETALLGTPQVVVYRTSGFTYALGRLLVRVQALSLVNILLGRHALRNPAVPELIQGACTPLAIVDQVEALAKEGTARQEQLAAYAELRAGIGKAGAAEKAARLILAGIRKRG